MMTNFRTIRKRIDRMEQLKTMPVSYTHLDVYKRQVETILPAIHHEFVRVKL